MTKYTFIENINKFILFSFMLITSSLFSQNTETEIYWKAPFVPVKISYGSNSGFKMSISGEFSSPFGTFGASGTYTTRKTNNERRIKEKIIYKDKIVEKIVYKNRTIYKDRIKEKIIHKDRIKEKIIYVRDNDYTLILRKNNKDYIFIIPNIEKISFKTTGTVTHKYEYQSLFLDLTYAEIGDIHFFGKTYSNPDFLELQNVEDDIPKVHFKNRQVYSFGTKKRDILTTEVAKFNHTFYIQNKGFKPLKIYSVKRKDIETVCICHQNEKNNYDEKNYYYDDCCNKIKFSKIVYPGETAAITIDLLYENFGKFILKYNVQTNVGDFELILKGKVIRLANYQLISHSESVFEKLFYENFNYNLIEQDPNTKFNQTYLRFYFTRKKNGEIKVSIMDYKNIYYFKEEFWRIVKMLPNNNKKERFFVHMKI